MRKLTGKLEGYQGVLGVVCVTAGVAALAGLAWALVVLGLFLLLATVLGGAR